MNATKIKLAKGLNAVVVTAVGGKMENVMMLMNTLFQVMGKIKCVLKSQIFEVSGALCSILWLFSYKVFSLVESSEIYHILF